MGCNGMVTVSLPALTVIMLSCHADSLYTSDIKYSFPLWLEPIRCFELIKNTSIYWSCWLEANGIYSPPPLDGTTLSLAHLNGTTFCWRLIVCHCQEMGMHVWSAKMFTRDYIYSFVNTYTFPASSRLLMYSQDLQFNTNISAQFSIFTSMIWKWNPTRLFFSGSYGFHDAYRCLKNCAFFVLYSWLIWCGITKTIVITSLFCSAINLQGKRMRDQVFCWKKDPPYSNFKKWQT